MTLFEIEFSFFFELTVFNAHEEVAEMHPGLLLAQWVVGGHFQDGTALQQLEHCRHTQKKKLKQKK